MKHDQRKAGVALTYLGEAIKILSGLIYAPIMLRLLGQSEYGLYQLVSATVAYLGLLSLGFGGAYVRYHARYRAEQDDAGIARLNGMFLIVFCGMSCVCLLCGGVMVHYAQALFGDGLSQPELEKAKILMAMLVVSMAITFPNSVFSCYTTAHERFTFQKLLNIFQGILNPFLALPLLLLGYGSVAVVAVSVILTTGSFVANVLFCVKRLNIRFSFRSLQLSLLKELAVFTFFIFLNQIIDQVNWSVDKFLLGRMSGTVAVAVYGVGGQLNAMYLQMSTAVSSVFVPRVNRIVAESDDNDALTRLMIKVGRVQFVILALIITGFVFFGRAFICLWAGAEYEQTYYVALLLMIPVTIPLIQNLGIEIQRAKNMHKARSIVYTCLAALNVVCSIFLIRIWGCVGAAVGTALSLLLGNGLFMNWYYHRRIGLNMMMFWKEILYMIPAVLIACGAGIVLTCFVEITGWGELLLAIVGYTLVYCASMWLCGLNKEEKKLGMDVLRKMHLVR